MVQQREISNSENEEYSDDDLFNISSWGADLSFREIITMYDEDEMVKPELQRNYVWDKKEASRFIETILLGLPVPSIFLANTDDEKSLIIDGYQRIMTVFDYVKGVFSKDKSLFKLTNNVNERWAGKAFNQLEDNEKRKILKTTIHAIMFEQKHPQNDDTSMYQIFERINTGGRTLTPQEIRNCVYHNEINTLLIKLNQDINWRALYGKDVESRMNDMEYILRFLYLIYSDFSKKKSIILKKELNKFMDTKINSSYSVQEYEEIFTTTMAFLAGKNAMAFNNIKEDGAYNARLNPTVFDSVAGATAQMIRYGKLEELEKISIQEFSKRHIELLNDKDFIEASSQHTTKVENINKRIFLAGVILYGETCE